MKKYMVADLVKDLKEDQIKYLLDNYNITRSDAKYIVDNYRDQYEQRAISEAMDSLDLNMRDAEEFFKNYPNQTDWPQVADAAEALGVGITDVTPDDVEAINAVEGTAVGKIDSNAGKFIYKLAIGTGLYYLWVTFPNEAIVAYQNLEPYEIKGIVDNGGAFYVDNIRIDSPDPDPDNPKVLCGCKHNPCSPAQIAGMPQI